MGVVVAVSSVLLIWGVKDFLAGRGASPETIEKIKSLVLQFDQVKSIQEISTMYLGSEKLLLNLDIEVNKSMTAEKIAEVTSLLKETLKKEVKNLTNIQIEINSRNK